MSWRTPPGPNGVRLQWAHGQEVWADYLLTYQGLQDGVNMFVITVPPDWYDSWREGGMEVLIADMPPRTALVLEARA